MKRYFALALALMMSCSLFVGSASAAISPELERGVDVSKEVAGEYADNYKDIEFNFELDVSKLTFTDDRWASFAEREGITYDAERGVLCFSLKAGDKISLDLPFGDDYTLEEVGGYDNENYVSTTVNGVESREHTFDVTKSDRSRDKVVFTNIYGEEEPEQPEQPVEPETPDQPTPDEPAAPEKPVSPQTGYGVGVLGLAAVAVVSGAVAVTAGKKAKKR